MVLLQAHPSNSFSLEEENDCMMPLPVDSSFFVNSFNVDRNSISSSPVQAASSDSSTTSKGKKQKEKPKRPLSAYNIFFQHARGRILEETPTRPEGKPRRSHGKIGFAQLARSIAAQWKDIDDDTRAYYDKLAAEDKERYNREMEVWKKEQMDDVAFEAFATTTTGTTATNTRPFTMNCAVPPLKQEISSSTTTTCFPGIASTNSLSSTGPLSVADILVMSVNSPAALQSRARKLQQQQQAQEPLVPPSILLRQQIPSNGSSSSGSTCTATTTAATPHISDLARKLDSECMELLLNMFQR